MWHKVELFLLELAIQLRNMWNHVREKLFPPLYWASLICGLPVCIYWTLHPPLAGVAIGALGATGVLVALKEKMPTNHRFYWAIITLFLLVIEVRAIENDRAEQFEAHLHELSWQREAQAQTLLNIAEANRAEMSQNDSQFQGTVYRMEVLGTLSQRAIKHLTGGDAFCYLVPMAPLLETSQPNTWQLAVGSSGDVDLPSCEATMMDLSAKPIPPQDWFRHMSFGRIHTSPGYVTITQYHIQGEAGRRYGFRIWTPTREFNEVIDFVADPSVPNGVKKSCELRDLFNGDLLWGGVDCPTLPVPKRKAPQHKH